MPGFGPFFKKEMKKISFLCFYGEIIAARKSLIVTFQIFKLSLFRSKMSYDLKKAEYDAEVNTAKAEADLAYDLKVSAEKGNHHKTPPLN